MSSDKMFTKLLSDLDYVETYAHLLRTRLDAYRDHVSRYLDDMGVPYSAGNAGVFLWIDLGRWVNMMTSDDVSDPGMVLALYLLGRGIFLQPGGVSDRSPFKMLQTLTS
jgi:hypothetical protein